MVQQFLELLSALGIVGLLIVMAIEGSSIPFPGIIIVLSYGYLFNPSLGEIAVTALIMALSYSLASYIPYIIGAKLGNKAYDRLKDKYLNALSLMNKYGAISIAVTRPFGAGNYISYVGGITRIKPLKYGILTFIGIYPWSFVMLNLGRLYKGNVSVIKAIIEKHSIYMHIVIILLPIVYIGFITIRHRFSAKTR